MKDITELSQTFHINAERGKGGEFPLFLRRVKGKRTLVLCDRTTRPFADPILSALQENGNEAAVFTFPSFEPVADEDTVAEAIGAARGFEYLLAVGAGTLNDIAKYAGSKIGIACGIYATAPSMDGFTSGVTPLIEHGFKITRNAQTASDVLMDFDLLASAPPLMRGAGAGDILAKHCCLCDWRLSSLLTGESLNEEAFSLMNEAVKSCDEGLPSLIRGERAGVEALMNALLVSGYAMVIAGSSRPASGAEHHMSHYLEMDFLRRGKRIPLHGVKVGLGTMVSLYLYHSAKDRPAFRGQETVSSLAEGLPSHESVKNTLSALGCPVRFSELDTQKDTVYRMFFEAYQLRDRFTVLTLYNRENLMKKAADELMETFW